MAKLAYSNGTTLDLITQKLAPENDQMRGREEVMGKAGEGV